MQTLIIAGNVGKDAVLRRTPSGEPVLGFSLAVDNGKDADGHNRPSTWFDCAIWGKRGEALERHITKGTRLTLSGLPTARAHDGKAYLGINVDHLTFMGRADGNRDGNRNPGQPGGDDGAASGRGASSKAQSNPPAHFNRDLEDDIPFAAEWRG